MNKIKTIKFWTTVLKEIEGKEECYFFLCEQSPTFKRQFHQEDRKYLLDLAKEFINQNHQWQNKFIVAEKSCVLFDIITDHIAAITNRPSSEVMSDDRKAIRVEFIHWMINYLRTKRKKYETTINRVRTESN